MEDLKNSVKRLEDKIDRNADKIITNMNKLHSHEDKINANAEKIQKNSLALDILRDIKQDNANLAAANKRLCASLILVLCMLAITFGYLVYILHDIGTIEEVTTQEVSQENEDGSNYFIGRDGDING